jgi:Uma2 family endonuclease
MTPVAEHPRRKVWTRDEVARLTDLFAGQRYELIEGDLINKVGQAPPHAYVVALLNTLFAGTFHGRVRVQLPITLPDPQGITSEPEPDIVVLHQGIPSSEFLHRHPSPSELSLLIEVADATYQMDRETKARLYARSGIELYWIIDIPQRRVIVLQGSGDEYKSATIYTAGEGIAFEGFSIPVDSLFG